MMDFVHRYDHAPRTGPKIFVGEWASLAGTPMPNFGSALADAAWMTSLERNSDLIVMSAYAPLLVNVSPGAMQWAPNLIGYDAGASYVSPSYYAMSLFAGHLGDGTPKTSLQGAGDRFFYSANFGSTDRVLHLKFVNASTSAQPMTIDLGKAPSGPATVFSLHGSTDEATNSPHDPNRIEPRVRSHPMAGRTLGWTVPGMTIEVLDIPMPR